MKNPFSTFLHAERMPAEYVHKWFSDEILRKGDIRTVSNHVTQLVVGSPGSGKTMILRRLTYEVKRQEINSPLKSALDSQEDYIGLYVNFDQDNVSVYSDGRLDEINASAALSDYIGINFALEFISAIADESFGKRAEEKELDRVANYFAQSLNDKAIESEISDWKQLGEYLLERRKGHHKFISYQNDLPQVKGYLDLVTWPSMLFAAALKANVLPSSMALFLILDQADRATEDKVRASVLSRSIVDTVRGGKVPVFLKIGLRFHTLGELEAASKLPKLDREIAKVAISNFDVSDRDRYIHFLHDMCLRRLKDTELATQLRQEWQELHWPENLKADDITGRLFNEFTLDNEALQIVKGREDQNLHITYHVDFWKSKNMNDLSIQALLTEVNKVTGVLSQLILLILISKKVKESKKIIDPVKDFKLYELIERVTTKQHHSETNEKFLEAGIMIMLRRYGKYQKAYSGFGSLAMCSGMNVAHFLEIMGKVVDEAPRYRDRDGRISLPISHQTQTTAVYATSREAWHNMQVYYSYGPQLAELLQKISDEMKKLLMLPWLPRTCFSGFDIPESPEDLIMRAFSDTKDSEIKKNQGERILALVLKDGFGSGYLKYEPIPNEGNSHRIWIDRRLLPHLRLPMQRKQRVPTCNYEELKRFFSLSAEEKKKITIIRDLTLSQQDDTKSSRDQLELF